MVRVKREDIRMVNGSRRPLAICDSMLMLFTDTKNGGQLTWKKEASTLARQRVLKTRPMNPTERKGRSFVAVERSRTGSSNLKGKMRCTGVRSSNARKRNSKTAVES
jgi:hypothetical protein